MAKYRYRMVRLSSQRSETVSYTHLILPVIARKCRSGFFIILSGFGISLLVETIQLITKVGCFDVDDLILNTLGAALGYLAFAVCNYLRRKCYGKKI